MSVVAEWSGTVGLVFWRAVGALLILVVGWVLSRVLSGGLRRALTTARVDPTLVTFCGHLAYVTALTLVVIAALHTLGFPTVSFAAVVGAAGLAIGLALKGTLSNLASGVLLIALRPFEVGDRIEAAGVTGVVRQIQVFATTLDTEDGRTVIIPNAKLSGDKITRFPRATTNPEPPSTEPQT